ncbi:MAG: YbaK/EbsC family protein [Desulfobacterales bacterium]|jgi:prolyl-tRNA editing enzyme YbaK/EbsC (Cys-tRNA(Pro) deacylase)
MPEVLNRSDLERFIEVNGIDATILPMNGHTSTVSDAARELGVAVGQIIKSLVFLADGIPFLVINNGLARVDRKKLAARWQIGRKRIKFASADQARDITGFVVGSMPPFGHIHPLPTLIDPSVIRIDTLFGGGGDIDAMMQLTPAELLRVTKAELTAVSED